MLLYHICWMEWYKNLQFYRIRQILHCFISHFHPEKEQEGKIYFLWPALDTGNTFQNIRSKLIMKFWMHAIFMSSMKYMVDKLNKKFKVFSHFVLAYKLSLIWREFCLFAHPHEKSELWDKQLCTTVCLKGPVKKYLPIARARNQTITYNRCHFLL